MRSPLDRDDKMHIGYTVLLGVSSPTARMSYQDNVLSYQPKTQLCLQQKGGSELAPTTIVRYYSFPFHYKFSFPSLVYDWRKEHLHPWIEHPVFNKTTQFVFFNTFIYFSFIGQDK